MLGLKSSWKFSDVQDNIEALKSQYEGVLMPFLCTQLKRKYTILTCNKLTSLK